MKTLGRFSLALASLGLGVATLGSLNPSLLAQSPAEMKAGPALPEISTVPMSRGDAAVVIDSVVGNPAPAVNPSRSGGGPALSPLGSATGYAPAQGDAHVVPHQSRGPMDVPGAVEVGPGPSTVMQPYGGTPSPFTGMNPWNAGPSCGPTGAVSMPCDQGCGCRNTIGIFADYLYLKARGTDLIFAQPRDGSTVLSSPVGPQGILDPDYASGFRVGLDWFINDCSSLTVTFTSWDVQTQASLAAPTDPIGAVIHSTIILPSIQNPAADGQSAFASMGLELSTGDVDYRHVLCSDPCHYTVNWLAGLRYAHLRQDMHSEFAILGTTDIDTNITFDGIGPRFGLDGDLVLCKGGLRLYAGSNVSLLAGHFGASFNQFNVFAGNQGSVDYKSDRIVPVVEAELGLGWVSPKGHVSVSAGYFVSCWFNTLTTPDYINAVQANNYSNSGGNLKSDMSFDGVTFRLEFRF